MKRLLLVLGIVVALVVGAGLAAPLFIDADSFRPDLEKRLSSALNRPVHIGKLQASLLRGGATAESIAIADDPAFGTAPFLEASSITIGLRIVPLIFSRQVSITSITLNKPEVLLLSNPAGKWNYSTLGARTSVTTPSGASSSGAPIGSAATSDFSVDKFDIVEGRVRVGRGGGETRERVYQNVNLEARNISLSGVMPFTLSATMPGGGVLDAAGHLGPLDREDSARTPMQATVKLAHVDLGASGFVNPGSGLSGTLDFHGTVQSDGKQVRSEGKAKASGLKLVKNGSAARAPMDFDYRSNYTLASQDATVSADLNAGSSKLTAGGDVDVDAHGGDSIAHLRVRGKDVAVNDVEGILPAFGVALPSGASLHGGVINMDLVAEGPLDRLVITGPVNISGTHLSGYNLGSNMKALSALTGIRSSNDTVIQTLSSAMRVAPEGIRADNIVLDIPEIGSLTGSGMIGNDNSLNFRMLLKVSNNSASLLGSLGGLTSFAQKQGIPFLIEGNTSKPVFRPALKNGLENAFSRSSNAGQNKPQQAVQGILDQLLKRKKP